MIFRRLRLAAAAVLLFPFVARAELKIGPWSKLPKAKRVAGSPAAKHIQALSPAPGAPASFAPNALTNFEGLNDNGTFIPPDTMGAIGVDQIVVIHNTEIRTLTKAGAEIAGSRQSLNAFWNALVNPDFAGGGLNFAYDPKVYFDKASGAAGRFYVVTLGNPRDAGNRMMLAVSKSSNPSDGWFAWNQTYPLTGDAVPKWFDYPGVGISSQWFVVTGAVYRVDNGNFVGIELFAFDKANLVAGGNPFPGTRLGPGFNAAANGAILMPSVNFDVNGDVYFIQNNWVNANNGDSRMLRHFRYTAAGAFEDLGVFDVINSSAAMPAAVPNPGADPTLYGAPQPGNCSVLGTPCTIHVGDDRILSVVLRNNKLWATHTVGMPVGANPTRSAVAWYSFAVPPAAPVQQGIVEDANGLNYYFPSIGVDDYDNVGLGFTGSKGGGAGVFASAYLTGRRVTDAANTMQAPTQYRAGGVNYRKVSVGDASQRNRWGDFSATMSDPNEKGVFWTIQQVAHGFTANTWATYWGKFTMFPAIVTGVAGLSPTVTGETQISISWGQHVDATGYKVTQGGDSVCVGGTLKATLADTAPRTYTDSTLTANTTLGLCVTPTNPNGSGPAVKVTTTTFAAALVAGTLSRTATSVTVTFTPPALGTASSFQAEAFAGGTCSGNASGLATTTNQSATSLTVGGLQPVTTYCVRLGSLNSRGAVVYTAVGNITTDTLLVPPAVGNPSNVTATSIQANWGQGSNPAGQNYTVRYTDDPAFVSGIQSSTTANYFAILSGLTPNTTYYFKVGAVSGPESDLPAVATLAQAPGSVSLSAPTETAATLSWTLGANPSPATQYRAESALTSDFSSGAAAQTLTAGPANFAGLTPNTKYWFRVRAINRAGLFAGTGSVAAATLANPPVAPGYVSVTFTSATVRWTLPAGGNSGYRVEAGPGGDFNSPNAKTSPLLDPAATEGGVSGLADDTQYTLRVGAANPETPPRFNYATLGSTRTSNEVSVAVVVTATGAVQSIVPSFPEATNVTLAVPSGALPPGTSLTMNSSVQFINGLPNSNHARVVPLGPFAAVEITAGGRQPEKGYRLPLTFTYNPASIPAGQDARRLQICRYDDVERVWNPIPSEVDTTFFTVRADLDHFSLFGPFFVTPGNSCAIEVSPVPWEVGTNGAFDAPGITFAALPAAADVRVFTIRGELLWEGTANQAGLLRWDGRNRHGVPAASGVYLAHIVSGQTKCLRRVVIVR